MHFLITSGGTREYIDPVRFISNSSSGRMGFALARSALKAGHKVTLVSAPTGRRPPRGAQVISVETSAEMFEEVRKHFDKCDCLIMAAAVSDYTPAKRANSKIKSGSKPLTIKLKPTVDILKWAGSHKRRNQRVVGFTLEDKQLRDRAEKKVRAKNLDMIVANAPAAIGAERSTVHIKTMDSDWFAIRDASKVKIAVRIIAKAETLFGL